MEKAAEEGHSYAMYNLGIAYKDGDGIPQDYEEAIRWWKKAAKAGNGKAMLSLGLAYVNGTGVSEDKNKAIKWLRKTME